MQRTLQKFAWFPFPFQTFSTSSYLKFTWTLVFSIRQLSSLYIQNNFDFFPGLPLHRPELISVLQKQRLI